MRNGCKPGTTKAGGHEHSRKFDPLDISADDQSRRDDGERHLEHDVDGVGNGGRGMNGAALHAGEKRLAQIPDPRIGADEGQRISAGKPEHRDQTRHSDAVHQH
jgi:hypothetical protein